MSELPNVAGHWLFGPGVPGCPQGGPGSAQPLDLVDLEAGGPVDGAPGGAEAHLDPADRIAPGPGGDVEIEGVPGVGRDGERLLQHVPAAAGQADHRLLARCAGSTPVEV